MSLDDDYTNDTEKGDRFIYWVAGGLAVVLVVIGLVSYRGAKENQEANAKADQFIALLGKAGVDPLPSQEQVARVLGDDGGSTCQDPSNALRKATLYSMLANGATGPGMRPIVADPHLFAGQLAVLSVYCPDELQPFKDYVDDLKTGDVVRS